MEDRLKANGFKFAKTQFARPGTGQRKTSHFESLPLRQGFRIPDATVG